MWTSFVCAAALSLAPAQAGELKLTNDYVTYGVLGSSRPDSSLLPGDVLFVALDAENIRVDPQGRILYSLGFEVVDAKGKSLLKQEPRDQEARNMLGGSTLPVFFHVNAGLDQPPGDYTLKMSVTDRTAKVTKTLERKFTVLKPDFGLVRLQLSTIDTQQPERFPAPPVAVVGQLVWVNVGAVGFARDNNKNPKLHVEMRILDEAGQPTLPQPTTGDVTSEIPESLRLVPMQFFLALNRAGKFTVELKATDQIANKTSTLKFPITVLPGR